MREGVAAAGRVLGFGVFDGLEPVENSEEKNVMQSAAKHLAC